MGETTQTESLAVIKETIFVMTLLGCGDAAKSCDYIQMPEREWITKSECSAAIPTVLEAFSDAPYPTITAVCEYKKHFTAVSSATENALDLLDEESGYSSAMFDFIRAKSENTEVSLVGFSKRFFEPKLLIKRSNLCITLLP